MPHTDPIPCPVCGRGVLRVVVTDHTFTVDGTPLTFASEVEVCSDCNTEMQSIEMMQRDVDKRAELKRKFLSERP